jgi:hypothetical protein
VSLFLIYGKPKFAPAVHKKIIKAKFDSPCNNPECRNGITAGDSCFYDFDLRQTFCRNCIERLKLIPDGDTHEK